LWSLNVGTIRTYRLTNSHFNLTVLELSEIRLETLPVDPIQGCGPG